jgi:hypothetical protein
LHDEEVARVAPGTDRSTPKKGKRDTAVVNEDAGSPFLYAPSPSSFIRA